MALYQILLHTPKLQFQEENLFYYFGEEFDNESEKEVIWTIMCYPKNNLKPR